MMRNDTLFVWYDDNVVGQLWQNTTGQIGFRYHQEWLNHDFAISQQLPLCKEPYSPSDGIAHRFFANLLPEANARMHIVRDLKISDSDFELLKAIGGDCAGALSILPNDIKKMTQIKYTPLKKDFLEKLLLRKGNISSFYSDHNHPRLSLAGAQDKCPIYYDGENYFLPQDASPSTHILKFEIPGFRNIPVYEYFLTQLAKKIGLPVVDCELKTMNDHYFLLITRYDRIIKSSKDIKRLHQEDFCQGLGVSYLKKYQQEGGPSFSDCYSLIKRISNNPTADTEHLMIWQMFNVLAGNSDGHAKNLAILYDKKQIRLAPFYDLVCTRAITRIDSKLALSVGDEFRPDHIKLHHWEALATSCIIGKNFLKKKLNQTAEALLDNISQVKADFYHQFGPYPALQRVEKVVIENCKRICCKPKKT